MFSFPYFRLLQSLLLYNIAQYPYYHGLSESSENVKTFFNDSQISMETRTYPTTYIIVSLGICQIQGGLIICYIFVAPSSDPKMNFLSQPRHYYYISFLSYFILQSFHFQIGENALFVTASEHQPLKRSIHQQFLSRFFPTSTILCLLKFDLLIYKTNQPLQKQLGGDHLSLLLLIGIFIYGVNWPN